LKINKQINKEEKVIFGAGAFASLIPPGPLHVFKNSSQDPSCFILGGPGVPSSPENAEKQGRKSVPAKQ